MGALRSHLMAESSTPGLGDLMGLFGPNNPFSGISKSIAQFQRGVSQFLDSVEEPIQAFVPQITRTIKAADALVDQLSGPIEKVAPSLNRFADMLSNPALLALPAELGDFMNTLGDLAQRLQPLGQLAESAGGWFGLRPLAALRSGSGTARSTPPVASPAPPPPPARTTAPATKAPAKRAPAKKVAPKKAAAATPDTAAPKKAAPKKAAPKKAASRKAAAKKTSARKAPPKKAR